MLKVPNQNGDRIVSASAGLDHLILLTQNGSVMSMASEYDQSEELRLGDIQEVWIFVDFKHFQSFSAFSKILSILKDFKLIQRFQVFSQIVH